MLICGAARILRLSERVVLFFFSRIDLNYLYVAILVHKFDALR